MKPEIWGLSTASVKNPKYPWWYHNCTCHRFRNAHVNERVVCELLVKVRKVVYFAQRQFCTTVLTIHSIIQSFVCDSFYFGHREACSHLPMIDQRTIVTGSQGNSFFYFKCLLLKRYHIQGVGRQVKATDIIFVSY